VVIGNSRINAQFPLDETDTIMDLMGISNLSIIFKDSKIIYNLAVPLIKPYNYTLYEVSPLLKLQKVNNTVSYIWPESPFIAIYKESNTYILISENQLKDCKRTKKILICTKMGLRIRIKRYSPCEVNIMMGKRTDELQHCDIRITKMETTFWKKLHTPYTWIYSTGKEEEITVG
jgi:hypothetical protein